MEIITTAIVAACLAYMISEINVLQKNMQRILIDIAVLQSLIPNKRSTDRE